MGQFNTYNPIYCEENKEVIERTKYTLDTLLTEYIQQSFTHASRWSFTACVQCKWANLHDDYNERE